MRTVALLAIALLAVSACKNDASTTEPASQPAPAESVAQAEEAPTPKRAPAPVSSGEPIFVAPQHPWSEEFHKLTITMVEEREIAFYAKPDLSSKVQSQKVLKPGSELEFTETQTHIFEPFVTKATHQVEVGGTTDDGTRLSKKLVPGDSFETLYYAGEGTCAIRIDGQVAFGTCPDGERFQAEGWSGKAPVPGRFDLWVKNKLGWALVDLDAVETKVESTL